MCDRFMPNLPKDEKELSEIDMSQKFNKDTNPPKTHMFIYIYNRSHLFRPFQGPSLLGYFICKLSNRNLSDGLHPIDASMNGCSLQ